MANRRHSDRMANWGRLVRAIAWPLLLAGVMSAKTFAENWPTYRHDAARSGITSEQLQLPLSEGWVFQARHAPRPAWGDPKSRRIENYLELRRVHFDDVFQVAVADGLVCFGSSANGKVYCLAAATGRIRWTRTTGGPVRLAPMMVAGKVYVGSDDGYVYCFRAKDGSTVWRLRAAPEDRRVLGNGRMISLYPVRTGVLVDRSVAYFGAGLFPTEGVFLQAVDAGDGRELWRNDSCGEFLVSKPINSSVSPQGYLLASETTLYAPMGRVSPAAFDRNSGRLKYVTYFGKAIGGTYALLAGKHVYTGTEEIVAFNQETRDRFAAFRGLKMVVTDDTAYLADDKHLLAMDRKSRDAKSPRWENFKPLRWEIDCPCHDSLILAGGVLFAGGRDLVMAVDAASGKVLWRGKVDGAAKGLAVADGRLLVSTDKGFIYCMGPEGTPKHGTVTEPVDENPYADSPHGAMFREAAETILRRTGIKRGFCLVLGCETGQLAFELAKRSELTIYAVSPDAKKVAAARKTLDAAGVYGDRVYVEQWPLDKVPYSDYFANLIVSETAMLGGDLPPSDELLHMLKPIGGTVIFGQPATLPEGVERIPTDTLRHVCHCFAEAVPRAFSGQKALLLRSSGTRAGELTADGGTWARFTRGPLTGAGNWTHQYAEPGNTACGDDQRVKSPFGVLWFGRPGPNRMVQRHHRAAGPLSLDGRMFIQGEYTVMCYDIYNGLKLWQREIPGAARIDVSRQASNMAVSDLGLFVAVEDRCLRLDPATGKTTATYKFPPELKKKSGHWGYVACVGELLFGSRSSNGYTSDAVFAVDIAGGKTRWAFKGKRIPNGSIAIGDGRVFLVDDAPGATLRRQPIAPPWLRYRPEPELTKIKKALSSAQQRRVIALDARTGRKQWEQPVDVSRCGGEITKTPYHNDVAAMVSDGVLTLFGIYQDGHYWKEFFAGEFHSRWITALDGKDGKLLWSKPIPFRVRPLIVGDTLHAEPWAFDLRTGEQRMRINPITGRSEPWQFARPGHHCGCPAASPHCLFFRSWFLAHYDLDGDFGTMHLDAVRPGCWINFIPAGGLLLMPEASAGCMCAFPIMSTVVLKPVEKNKTWALYSAPGPMKPVRRLALNLGVSGDRKDSAGRLWLGYPRLGGHLVLKFDLAASFYPGGGFVRRNSDFTKIAGTDDPWLFASAAAGLREITIPLVGPADGKALYRVRLAMSAPEGDKPGRRVFGIRLQGKPVLEEFDIAAEAGRVDRAVIKEFRDIEVGDNLRVELVAKTPNPTKDQWPILQGIEIVRQRFLTLGCSTPDFLVGSLMPKQTGRIHLANLREEPFVGTLKLVAPRGFNVSPKETEIKLALDAKASIPVEVTLTADVPAGDYEIPVRLLRPDGTLELGRTIHVKHIGRRGRVVLPAVEDAYVVQHKPKGTKGSAGILLVDGGGTKLGDRFHAQAYLKFRVDVPGKPVSVTLRLYNAGDGTTDSSRIRLVSKPWSEKSVNYSNRPKPGPEVGRIGPVGKNKIVECPLRIDLTGKSELSLMIDPTGLDAVDFLSHESGKPAELVIEYERDE